MTSKIIVNNIQSDTGVSTVTIASPVALSGGITGTGFAVGTGASISSPATNVLTLGTNNVERVRVDSSGHFIMPAGSFDLMVGDSTNSNAGTQTISVGSTASGSSGGIQLWANPTNGNSWIQFGDNSASASQYRGWVNYQHADDNLNFGTAGTERLRIDSSGRVTTPYQPFFYAKAGASRDNQTSNPTVFNNVVTNVGNHYDGTTNYRFTAPVAGVYLFTSQPGYKETSDDASWKLYKNGAAFTDFVRVLGGLTSHSGWSCAALVYLNVNEYVHIGWDGSAGGYHQNSDMSYFSGVLIG
jgi:hypothetical protein